MTSADDFVLVGGADEQENKSTMSPWERYLTVVTKAVEGLELEPNMAGILVFHQSLFNLQFLQLQARRKDSPFLLDEERRLTQALLAIPSFPQSK